MSDDKLRAAEAARPLIAELLHGFTSRGGMPDGAYAMTEPERRRLTEVVTQMTTAALEHPTDHPLVLTALAQAAPRGIYHRWVMERAAGVDDPHTPDEILDEYFQAFAGRNSDPPSP